MKTNARYFKAVQAEMKLEHSISRSKKKPWRNWKANEASGVCHCVGYSVPRSSGYQQRLYGEILKSVLANADPNPLHKELRNRNISEYNDIKKNITKEASFMKPLCH